MNFKRLLVPVVAIAATLTAYADLPYREHRYDSFMAAPPVSEPGKQIVFFGNSITNLHNWNEAFGSDPNVVNRGNSGGYVYELIEEVENFTDSKPAKVFIGIGTNDLAIGRTPEQVTTDTRTLIRRIQIASPETEINVQSILPRAGEVWNKIQTTIPMVKAVCDEMGVNFIDLTDTMMGVRTITGNSVSTWAPDGLHPSGRGYRAWSNFIKDRVNGICSYSNGNYHSELTYLTNPSRISQFSLLPVDSDDILFVGDEMVENGEWNELLSLPQIKKRSNGYGHGGIGLLATNGARDLIKVSLTTDASTQKAPAKILIYCGVSELSNYTSAATYKANYKTLINYIKGIAPTTSIYAVSMLSVNNDALARQYNAALKEIADADDAVTYIDIYTELKANEANSMWGNYVNGRGYVRIANILAPYLSSDGAKAVTLDEFETYYANRQNRKAVGIVYNSLYNSLRNPDNFGTNFGQYPEATKTSMEDAASAIEAALAAGTVTDQQKTALIAQANESLGQINLPAGFDGRYYRLVSQRGSAVVSVVNGNINGLTGVSPDKTDGSDVWRFEKRADGNLDIISLSGKYIVPNSGSSTTSVAVSASQPTLGWKVAKSEVGTGTVVFYGEDGNNRWQLNQQNNGSNIYNWYGTVCPNTSDDGCSYTITEFTGFYGVEGEEIDPRTGWYYLEGATGLESLGTANRMTNVNSEWRQTNVFSYPLKYAATNTEKPATHFVHITMKADGKWYFTSINGHGLKENATASRNSIPEEGVDISVDGDLYQIGRWTSYDPNSYGSYYNEAPIVGKSYSSNVRHKVTKVPDEDLAPYDIWSVEILGANATEVINDPTLTLNIEANKGISTVYNGGTYFITKGTTLSESDFTFGSTKPVLTIDNKAHTIKADYNTTAVEEPEGKWYTIVLHSAAPGSIATVVNWVNTELSDKTTTLQAADREYQQSLGGNYNYYGISIAAAPATDEAAKAFFYMTETAANTSTVRLITGHYVLDNGCSSINPSDLIFTPHASDADVFMTTWCPWKGNNIGAPGDLIGKFSGNYCYYTIEPADVTPYDLYTVEIVGRDAPSNPGADFAVTLSGVEQYGLASVFNGGTFFVKKGVEVTPDMISAPQKPRRVTVTPGKIIVSYNDDDVPALTEIVLSETEVTLTEGEELLLRASGLPEDAQLGMVIFTSSDPEVAKVTLGGLVTAVKAGTAVITATCGDVTATCTVTVEAAVPEVTGIIISNNELTLGVGETFELTATIEPADAEGTITWSSSDEEVATVDDNGVVTAHAEGTAVISATCGEFTATCTVSVKKETGITDINVDGAYNDAVIYNLMGRRIFGNPAPGIYIVNGQKVLVK